MEYYTSGQMAESNCVTKKTLRFYHEKGLLTPEFVDEENCRRYYTSEQSYQIDLIQHLQAIGLSITEIAEALQDEDALEKTVRQQVTRLTEQQRILAAAQEHACDLAEGIAMR